MHCSCLKIFDIWLVLLHHCQHFVFSMQKLCSDSEEWSKGKLKNQKKNICIERCNIVDIYDKQILSAHIFFHNMLTVKSEQKYLMKIFTKFVIVSDTIG